MTKIISEETRAKMRAAKLGKPKSDAHKANMSKAKLGKPLPESTCQKMSESKMGHEVTDETREKISEMKIKYAAIREKFTGFKYNLDDSHIMTSDSRQFQKPYWINDDCWTEFKTNCELWHLVDIMHTRRNLWQCEKDWINAIFKGIVITDNFD